MKVASWAATSSNVGLARFKDDRQKNCSCGGRQSEKLFVWRTSCYLCQNNVPRSRKGLSSRWRSKLTVPSKGSSGIEQPLPTPRRRTFSTPLQDNPHLTWLAWCSISMTGRPVLNRQPWVCVVSSCIVFRNFATIMGKVSPTRPDGAALKGQSLNGPTQRSENSDSNPRFPVLQVDVKVEYAVCFKPPVATDADEIWKVRKQEQ
jgi:hypothetical protein